MSHPLPPTIDPVAAQRWQQRAPVQSPWLHEEVARRMQSRLQWITTKPRSWLHWSPLQGGVLAHEGVAACYPQARSYVTQPHPSQLQTVQKALQPSWWRRLQQPASVPVFAAPAAPVDMLWANMALHMAADPLAMIAQWHALLAVDGFLMFSCLGPDTLREIRGLYAANAWQAPSHDFTDMHDWGDMLVRSGFAEPIVDMERVTLTYSSPQSLLQELRTLGRNLHPQRFAALRGRDWLTRLHQQLQAQLQHPQEPGRLQLTFEIIYGHAFKPKPRLHVKEHSSISLEDMRRTLGVGAARPRSAGNIAE